MVWNFFKNSQLFDLNLVIISSMAAKCQDFEIRSLQFHFIKQLKNCHSKFKDLLFWSEDIMNIFKPQALYIMRINYWKASGICNPQSFISALLKIAIVGLKTKSYVLFCTRLYLCEKLDNRQVTWQAQTPQTFSNMYLYQYVTYSKHVLVLKSQCKHSSAALTFLYHNLST